MPPIAFEFAFNGGPDMSVRGIDGAQRVGRGVVAVCFSRMLGAGQWVADVGGRDDVGALLRSSAPGQDSRLGIDDRRCRVGGRAFCDGGGFRLFWRLQRGALGLCGFGGSASGGGAGGYAT